MTLSGFSLRRRLFPIKGDHSGGTTGLASHDGPAPQLVASATIVARNAFGSSQRSPVRRLVNPDVNRVSWVTSCSGSVMRTSVTADLGLPATAGEMAGDEGSRTLRGLKRLVRRLQRDERDGVPLRDGRPHVARIKTTATPEVHTFADRSEAIVVARVRRSAEHDARSSHMWSVVGATGITTTSQTICQCFVAGNETLSGLALAHTLRTASIAAGGELSLSGLGKALHGDC